MPQSRRQRRLASNGKRDRQRLGEPQQLLPRASGRHIPNPPRRLYKPDRIGMSSPRMMTRSSLLANLVAIIGLGVVQAAAQTAPPFNVGVATRAFVPAEPYEWRSDKKHALATMIWYPADPSAEGKPQLLGPPGTPLFDGGQAAADAALAPKPAKFPFIVLSHGTGGTSGDLAWLGTRLARAGHIAAAVNHPGNNAIDGYTVQGFTLWWGTGAGPECGDRRHARRPDLHDTARCGADRRRRLLARRLYDDRHRRGRYLVDAFPGILRLAAS